MVREGKPAKKASAKKVSAKKVSAKKVSAKKVSTKKAGGAKSAAKGGAKKVKKAKKAQSWDDDDDDDDSDDDEFKKISRAGDTLSKLKAGGLNFGDDDDNSDDFGDDDIDLPDGWDNDSDDADPDDVMEEDSAGEGEDYDDDDDDPADGEEGGAVSGPYEKFLDKMKSSKNENEKEKEKKKQREEKAKQKSEFGEAMKYEGVSTTVAEATKDEDTAALLWHEQPLPLKKASLNEMASCNLDMDQIKSLYREGEEELFKLTEQHKKVEPWIFNKVAKEGTAHDKIMTLALQLTRPNIHTRLHLLEQLLNLAGKKSKDQQKEAAEALNNLWVSHILPKNRKLLEFAAQPFAAVPNAGEDRNKVLMFWYIEDRIKKMYATYVLKIMGTGLSDQFMFMKNFWMNKCYALLNQIPEQETTLLAILADKLGDSSARASAKAVHLLRCFIGEHPRMKDAVTHEMERFLFRANNRVHARHYASLVLNSIALKAPDKKLAKKLLMVYLALFKQLVADGDVEHRMMNSLLRGIGRVIPHLGKKEDLSNYYNTLFTVAACGAFPHRVSALSLIFQLVERGDQAVEKRFYQSLYRLLNTAPHVMPNTERLVLFFSLLYKALVWENKFECQISFIHRLLQMCQQQMPTYICSTLLLMSELGKEIKPLKMLITGDKAEVPTDDADEPYDPSTRQPFYTHAENECLWLLERLSHHYHPVVVKFSMHLCSGVPISYAGNPLMDFTLVRFLDNYVYKQPKLSRVKRNLTDKARDQVLYNSEDFRNQPVERVQMDELFYYKFARQRHEREMDRLREMKRVKKARDAGKNEATDKAIRQQFDGEFEDDEGVDMFNRFSYDNLNEDDIAKEEGGDADLYEEDEFDYPVDPEDDSEDDKGKAVSRAERRRGAREAEEEFDVETAKLKSKKRSAKSYEGDADDFDRMMDAGRKSMRSQEKFSKTRAERVAEKRSQGPPSKKQKAEQGLHSDRKPKGKASRKR